MIIDLIVSDTPQGDGQEREVKLQSADEPVQLVVRVDSADAKYMAQLCLCNSKGEGIGLVDFGGYLLPYEADSLQEAIDGAMVKFAQAIQKAAHGNPNP